MSHVNWRGVVRDLAILAALSGIALSVVWVGNALWEATAIVDTHHDTRQVPNFVWIGLLGLGLAACYGGFAWAGRLFDQRRDIGALLVAGSVIPGGAALAACAIAAWLGY